MGRSADTLPKALRTLRLASVELVLGTNILETKAIGKGSLEAVMAASKLRNVSSFMSSSLVSSFSRRLKYE